MGSGGAAAGCLWRCAAALEKRAMHLRGSIATGRNAGLCIARPWWRGGGRWGARLLGFLASNGTRNTRPLARSRSASHASIPDGSPEGPRVYRHRVNI
jgi:hypothetical protein